MESAIRLGTADVATDVVDTGTTLQHAGLEVFGEPIYASEAILIRRDEGTEFEGLASLRTRLELVLMVQSYLTMDYSVAEPDLGATTAPASGVNDPTVFRLVEPGWMTVQVLVPRCGAHLLMDRLFEAGTRGTILTEPNTVRL